MIIIIAFGLVAIFILLFNLVKMIPKNSAPAVTAVVIEESKKEIGLPVRLMIPAINVDAAIGYAGIASDGTMEISESQDDVAWYEPGVRPGNVGSAVVAGHYGSLNGKSSVFSDLSELNKGDKLSVQDHNGNFISFVVRESRKYDPDADATEVFSSSDSGIHLNLVTCEGSWNSAKDSYSDRRVIFTDMVVE